jgi:hypothetical protein
VDRTAEEEAAREKGVKLTKAYTSTIQNKQGVLVREVEEVQEGL